MTMREGDDSMAVYALQTDLGVLGYQTTMNGVYGRLTTNAIGHFQETHGLTVTGLADTVTVRRVKLEIQERARRLAPAVAAAGAVA